MPDETPDFAASRTQSALASLRTELRDFVVHLAAKRPARDGGDSGWPVELETECFELGGTLYDRVQMDEDFKFYLSSTSRTGVTPSKLGFGYDGDVTAMCAAARKAMAAMLQD